MYPSVFLALDPAKKVPEHTSGVVFLSRFFLPLVDKRYVTPLVIRLLAIVLGYEKCLDKVLARVVSLQTGLFSPTDESQPMYAGVLFVSSRGRPYGRARRPIGSDEPGFADESPPIPPLLRFSRPTVAAWPDPPSRDPFFMKR